MKLATHMMPLKRRCSMTYFNLKSGQRGSRIMHLFRNNYISIWENLCYKLLPQFTSPLNFFYFFFYNFSVRLLSFCVVIRFFHPRHNGQWPPTSKDFLSQIYPLQLFSYLNSWERASIFPIECSVLNKGTTGTILITSLVWRGPWLGIEPGTSRTRSQHWTTRLSRRR